MRRFRHLDAEDAFLFWAVFGAHYEPSLEGFFDYLSRLHESGELAQKFEKYRAYSPQICRSLKILAKNPLRWAINRAGPRREQARLSHELEQTGIMCAQKDFFGRCDRLYFVDNFERFYFYFAPVLSSPQAVFRVQERLNAFCAQSFERAALEYASERFGELCGSARSLWSKDFEVDIYARNLIGEVKFKASKMTSAELNLLQKKARILGLQKPIILLFSLSGYSQNLHKIRSDKLHLLSLKNFEELL